MRNKQKAWRLGAAVMSVPGRTHKAQATLLGSALRDPATLRSVMGRLEILAHANPYPAYEAPRRRTLRTRTVTLAGTVTGRTSSWQPPYTEQPRCSTSATLLGTLEGGL